MVRIAMATGDLWLDEVWSLDLVRPLSSPLDVFTRISHDNNHFLNSLWLFLAGPGRAPWLYRAPSVVLGTTSIGLAAWVLWHRSRAAAVIAALLCATAMPLVIYGSEARGYAGLVASTLLAFKSYETAVESPPGSHSRRRATWLLGAAIGIGTLFHFTMLATLAVLGLSALMRFAADRPPAQAFDAAVAIFSPALACLIPAMAAVMAGIVIKHGFEVGNNAPGTVATFVQGYGSLWRTLLGIPVGVPLVICFLVAGVLLLVSLGMRGLSQDWRTVIFAAVFALPLAMVLLRCPNLEFSRYYLVCGLVFLVTVADLAGRLWDRGGGWRMTAVGLGGLLLFAQGVTDASALAVGRGHYGEALSRMADQDRRVRYATRDGFWVSSVAQRAARSRDLRLDAVAERQFCGSPPPWFIDVAEFAGPPAPSLMAGPPECRLRFEIADVVATNPLSGMTWNIYRRAGP